MEVDIPAIPWRFDRTGTINWGSIILKATYRAVEREKAKSEIQDRSKSDDRAKRKTPDRKHDGQDRGR